MNNDLALIVSKICEKHMGNFQNDYRPQAKFIHWHLRKIVGENKYEVQMAHYDFGLFLLLVFKMNIQQGSSVTMNYNC